MMTRTYGRDGDTYGQHALVNPGGDNTQRDVLHIVPPRLRDAYRIHPTLYNPEYVGTHRVTWWNAQEDYPVLLSEWADS